MQFSSLGGSKMEISKTDSFDILPIQNDEISYAKLVLAPLYVFLRPLVVHLHVVRVSEPSHNPHVFAPGGPS